MFHKFIYQPPDFLAYLCQTLMSQDRMAYHRFFTYLLNSKFLSSAYRPITCRSKNFSPSNIHQPWVFYVSYLYFIAFIVHVQSKNNTSKIPFYKRYMRLHEVQNQLIDSHVCRDLTKAEFKSYIFLTNSLYNAFDTQTIYWLG